MDQTTLELKGGLEKHQSATPIRACDQISSQVLDMLAHSRSVCECREDIMSTCGVSVYRPGPATIVMGLSLWLCAGCVEQAPGPSAQGSKSGGDVVVRDSRESDLHIEVSAGQASDDQREVVTLPVSAKPGARRGTQPPKAPPARTVSRQELLEFGFVESEDPLQRVNDRENRIRKGLPILTTYRIEQVKLKDLASLLGFDLDDITAIPGASPALSGIVARIRNGTCHLEYEPREQLKNPEAVVDATVCRYEPSGTGQPRQE